MLTSEFIEKSNISKDKVVKRDKIEIEYNGQKLSKKRFSFIRLQSRNKCKILIRTIYDNIKKEYCEYNNIKLIIIRYDDIDIQKIIEEIL